MSTVFKLFPIGVIHRGTFVFFHSQTSIEATSSLTKVWDILGKYYLGRSLRLYYGVTRQELMDALVEGEQFKGVTVGFTPLRVSEMMDPIPHGNLSRFGVQ